MADSRQWVRVYCLNLPYRVEIVHAHYVDYRFVRHAHAHYVIGLVEQGVQQYHYRGATHTTPAGQIFFVNGGEPHTGEPAIAGGYLYRTLCLDPGAFRQLASDITNTNQLPYLEGTVVRDDRLFARLRRLHSAVAANAPAMHTESFLLSAVRCLLEKHTQDRGSVVVTGRETALVGQVREYLDANYSRDISLTDLGVLTSRSPFHVARAFSKALGLPPHAYLESRRIQRARELLRSGVSVVDTALAVGYSDQSHFTHRFRSHTGFTPGQYSRNATAADPLLRRV